MKQANGGTLFRKVDAATHPVRILTFWRLIRKSVFPYQSSFVTHRPQVRVEQNSERAWNDSRG
jgi:hypothetical protein